MDVVDPLERFGLAGEQATAADNATAALGNAQQMLSAYTGKIGGSVPLPRSRDHLRVVPTSSRLLTRQRSG